MSVLTMPVSFIKQFFCILFLILFVVALIISAIVTLTRPAAVKKQNHTNIEETRRKFFRVNYHPYTVSLSIELENTATNKRVFACNGAILSKDWVLVGGDCIEHEIEWSTIQIRAGSIYWNRGGTTHIVKEYIYSRYRTLTALKVEPIFTFNDYISSVKLGNVHNWKEAYVIDWYHSKRKENEKCFVRTWMNFFCTIKNSKLGEIVEEVTCSVKLHGNPLVTKGKFIIAFQIGVCRHHNRLVYKFVDLRKGIYARWLSNLLKSDENVTYAYVESNVLNSSDVLCGSQYTYMCETLFPDELPQETSIYLNKTNITTPQLARKANFEITTTNNIWQHIPLDESELYEL